MLLSKLGEQANTSSVMPNIASAAQFPIESLGVVLKEAAGRGSERGRPGLVEEEDYDGR